MSSFGEQLEKYRDNEEVERFRGLLELVGDDERLFGVVKDSRMMEKLLKYGHTDLAIQMIRMGEFAILAEDYRFEHESTLLEYVAYLGWDDVMDFLLDAIGYEPKVHERPLHFACLGKRTNMVARFLDRGENPNALFVHGDRVCGIELGGRFHEGHMSNPRPLHLASTAGAVLGIVDLLLTYGADPRLAVPTVLETDELFQLPIHVAAWSGEKEVVVRLLDHSGVDQLFVGKGGQFNYTPLQNAIVSHHMEVVMAIMEYPHLENYEFAQGGGLLEPRGWLLRRGPADSRIPSTDNSLQNVSVGLSESDFFARAKGE